MKAALRIALGLLALLVLTVVAIAILGEPATTPIGDRLAGPVIERALADAGVERPVVEITSLTPSGAAADLRAADGALSARLRVAFEPRRLWRERRVGTVTLERADGTLTIGPGGGVAVRGFTPPPSERRRDDEPLVLPFDRLVVADLTLTVETPAGDVLTETSGAFAPATGGRFSLNARSKNTVNLAGRKGEASGTGEVVLSPDGGFALTATLAAETDGDLTKRGALAVEGSGASWRDLLEGRTDELRGTGSVRTKGLLWTLPADTSLRPLLTEATEGVIPLSIDTALRIEAARGHVAVSALPDAAASLTVTAPAAVYVVGGDDPLLVAEDGGVRLDLTIRATGTPVTGQINAAACRAADAPWTLDVDADLDDLSLYGFDLSAVVLTTEGTLTDDLVRLVGETTATLHSADVGVVVEDAPFETPFALTVARDADKLVVALPEGECLTAPRARISLPGGTVTSRARDLSVCAGEGALLAREAETLTLDAGVSARTAPVTVGTTEIGLSRPRIDLTVRTDEAGPVVTAEVTGGTASLPGGIVAEGLGGTVRVVPDRAEDVLLTAALRRARLRQDADAPLISPLLATGEATLRGGALTFAGEVATAKGRPIGVVLGEHDVGTAAGGATLDATDLTFAPGGLQPAALLPVLSGVVGRATGTVEATLRAGWGPDGITSGGTIALDDLSFQGPGVAIARTAGLTGTVTLDGLAPVRTDGAQTLGVGLLDLRAIQLAGGEARFVLPGDDTVVIEQAAFPWLGGQVGVYETIVGFDGGGRAVLRGEDLEIGEALGILDVPGLTGEGQVKARLPLSLDAFSVRIDEGSFTSTRPGVIRYKGEATAAVADRNEQAKLAFGVLEDLRYDELSGTVDGPLAGSLRFGFTIEGTSALELPDKRVREPVVAPIIYRLNIEAPLLQLIDQARLSTDARRQIERGMIEGRGESDAEREGTQD